MTIMALEKSVQRESEETVKATAATASTVNRTKRGQRLRAVNWVKQVWRMMLLLLLLLLWCLGALPAPQLAFCLYKQTVFLTVRPLVDLTVGKIHPSGMSWVQFFEWSPQNVFGGKVSTRQKKSAKQRTILSAYTAVNYSFE